MSRGPASPYAAVVTLLAMTWAGPLHLLAQPHALCPVDGELVHADSAHEAHADPADHRAPGDGRRAEGAAHPARAPAAPPADHRHDQPCTVALQLRAPGGVTSTPLAPHVQPRDLAVALMPASSMVERRAIGLLSLAPSHSPPA